MCLRENSGSSVNCIECETPRGERHEVGNGNQGGGHHDDNVNDQVTQVDVDRAILKAHADKLLALLPKKRRVYGYQPELTPPRPMKEPWSLLPYSAPVKRDVPWIPVQEQDLKQNKLDYATLASMDAERRDSEKRRLKGCFRGANPWDPPILELEVSKIPSQQTFSSGLPAPFSECTMILDKEIRRFAQFVGPTKVEMEARKCMLADLHEAITAKFPRATINPFGSYAADLSVFSSDIDLTIEGVGVDIDEEGKFEMLQSRPNSRNTTSSTSSSAAEGEKESEKDDHDHGAVGGVGRKRTRDSLTEEDVAGIEEKEEEEQEGEEEIDVTWSEDRGRKEGNDNESQESQGISEMSTPRNFNPAVYGANKLDNPLYKNKYVDIDIDTLKKSVTSNSTDLDYSDHSSDESMESVSVSSLKEGEGEGEGKGKRKDKVDGDSEEEEELLIGVHGLQDCKNHSTSGIYSDVEYSIDSNDSQEGLENEEYKEYESDRESNSRAFYLRTISQEREDKVTEKEKKEKEKELKLRQGNLLRTLYNHLLGMDWMAVSELRARARVPIIAMNHRNGLSADVSLGVSASTHTSVVRHLRGRLYNGEDAFTPLSRFLKIFLGLLNLDKPFSGGVGSFKLYVMIAFVIEVGMREQEYEREKNFADTRLSSQNSAIQKEGPDLGYLLRLFFRIFGLPQNLNQKTTIPILCEGAYWDVETAQIVVDKDNMYAAQQRPSSETEVAFDFGGTNIKAVQRTFERADALLSGKLRTTHFNKKGQNGQEPHAHLLSNSTLSTLLDTRKLVLERKQYRNKCESYSQLVRGPPVLNKKQQSPTKKTMQTEIETERETEIENEIEIAQTRKRDCNAQKILNALHAALHVRPDKITIEQVRRINPTLFAKIHSFYGQVNRAVGHLGQNSNGHQFRGNGHVHNANKSTPKMKRGQSDSSNGSNYSNSTRGQGQGSSRSRRDDDDMNMNGNKRRKLNAKGENLIGGVRLKGGVPDELQEFARDEWRRSERRSDMDSDSSPRSNGSGKSNKSNKSSNSNKKSKTTKEAFPRSKSSSSAPPLVSPYDRENGALRGVVGEAFMPKPKVDDHNANPNNYNPNNFNNNKSNNKKRPLKIQEREHSVVDLTNDSLRGRNESSRERYGLIDLT